MDFWETTSRFILVFSFPWYDTGCMYGFGWCFFYGPLYLAATCSVLFFPEECGGGFFWEVTFGGCRVQILLWFNSGCIFLSVHALVSSPGEYEKIGIFSGVEFMIFAWFDSGYIFVSRRVGLVA